MAPKSILPGKSKVPLSSLSVVSPSSDSFRSFSWREKSRQSINVVDDKPAVKTKSRHIEVHLIHVYIGGDGHITARVFSMAALSVVALTLGG